MAGYKKRSKGTKAKAKTKVKNKQATKYRTRESAMPLPVKNSKAKTAKTKWENTTEFDILEDVPLPWTRIGKGDIAYPFLGMEIGRSFQFMLEKDKGQNVYSATVSFCRRPEHFNKKFVVRKVRAEKLKGVDYIVWGCWRDPDLTPEELEAKTEKMEAEQRAATRNRRARVR